MLSNLEIIEFENFLWLPNWTRPVLGICLIQLFPNWTACSPITYTNEHKMQKFIAFWNVCHTTHKKYYTFLEKPSLQEKLLIPGTTSLRMRINGNGLAVISQLMVSLGTPEMTLTIETICLVICISFILGPRGFLCWMKFNLCSLVVVIFEQGLYMFTFWTRSTHAYLLNKVYTC